jgi:hypothetical protein
VLVAAHADLGRDRAVGDHQVEAVHRELGEQLGQRRLAAHQPARALQAQRRLDQAMHHRLGHRVRDADAEGQAAAQAVVAQRLHDLVAEREDLLGLAQDAFTRFGQRQAAAAAAEQGDAERALEGGELGADRVRRQPEHPPGLGDRAHARHRPEIAQVLVVELAAAHDFQFRRKNRSID